MVELDVDSATLFVALAYGTLFFVALWLVYVSPRIGVLPPLSTSFENTARLVVRLAAVAILVVAPLYYLMQMNVVFQDVFEKYGLIDNAASKLKHAFDSDGACRNTYSNVTSAIVHNLFESEYGYIIDIVGYLDLLVPAFYGFGIFVLAFMLKIAVATWTCSTCAGRPNRITSLMPIFLSFQIIFPGIVSIALGLLYTRYEPTISNVDHIVTRTLHDVQSVANCATLNCTLDDPDNCHFQNSFDLVLMIVLGAVPQLEAIIDVPGCLSLIERAMCDVKTGLDDAVDKGASLNEAIFVYNYVALGCISLFIILTPYLARRRQQNQSDPEFTEFIPMQTIKSTIF